MMALLLVLALFYLHALLLLDVAGLMVKDRAPLIEIIGPGHAGKALIIWSFVVLFVAHVLEAAAWGLFMRWRRLCTNFPEGLYFAIVTMTTLGYGDVVLPPPWRNLGPLMVVSGLLMFGCSTAFLFVVIQEVWLQRI